MLLQKNKVQPQGHLKITVGEPVATYMPLKLYEYLLFVFFIIINMEAQHTIGHLFKSLT